jgi:hypothetical protein
MGITLSSAFPSKYLKVADFSGKPISYTIHSAQIEELGSEKERKPVVYFRETNKGLPLNRTNFNVIVDAYGDDSDRWVGKPLEVFRSRTHFAGKMVDCVRVQTPIGADLNDEIPDL